MISKMLFGLSFILIIYSSIMQYLKYRKTKKFGYKDRAVASLLFGMIIMLLTSRLMDVKGSLFLFIFLIGAFFTFIVPVIYIFVVAYKRNI